MRSDHDQLTATVIGAAIEVHRVLGPGLFETVYEECLAWELAHRSLSVRRQAAVPVVYKGVRLDASYRIDLLVDEKLVVEVKSVERVLGVHEAQIVTYLKMSGLQVGLLLNFNTAVLKDGVRRFGNMRTAGETGVGGTAA